MAAEKPGNRRWCGAALLLGVLLAVVAAPAPVRAQAAVQEFYSAQRAFRIPFTEPAGRVQRVLLQVSDDNGRNWQQAATAVPGDRTFSYTAPHDGWFLFSTQTQDAEGHLVPADVRQLQPLIKICVDTQKPVIAAFRQVTPREGTVAVEWDVQDENLDPLSVRIDYRPLGSTNFREWLALRIPPTGRGEQGWTPPMNIPLEVHLWVKDKAGNAAEATLNATPGRPAPAGGGAGAPPVKHVQGRKFQLRCKITNQGESGLQGIDVYVLRDNVWQKFSAAATQYKTEGDKASVSITVGAAGRWGFTLIPRSGVGLSEPPPRPGDPPHIWIEVDETRPTVAIKDVVVGQGQDLGRMTVYWSASDVHLRPKPITLSYSATKDGPWTPLASQVENTGLYAVDTRSISGLPFQFFLKVEAADEAGNVGSAVTKDTVKIDTKIPKADGVDVEAPGEGPGRPADMPMTPGG
jgi:hypothetical protein